VIEFHDQPDMNLADLAVWQQEVSGGIDPVTGITCAGIIILTFLPRIEYSFAVALADAFANARQLDYLSSGSPVTVGSYEANLKWHTPALVVQPVHLIQHLLQADIS